jgi:predicted helicase
MVAFYNAEAERYRLTGTDQDPEKFATVDTKRISWTRGLRNLLAKGRTLGVSEERIVPSIYRPFERTNLYFDRQIIEMILQNPKFFPSTETENLIITIKGNWRGEGQFALMMNSIFCSQPDGGAQCFPLYLYEETQPDDGLFAASGDQAGGLTRRDAITDEGLAHFQAAYPGQTISKEDLCYYIYGLLHSPDYRERFKNTLAKQLPRIPAVKTFADFTAFRDAGRALGDLHVNFETVAPYMVTFKEGDHRLIPEAEANPKKFYRVKKMKFGGKGKEKDRTTVIYNENITMQNIPLEAYDYVVNGKPALEWVMERQVVKTDKKSGIVNDANDYANETVGDPKYPLELFQRVITVSLETMRIVNGLPRLEID